MIAAFPGDNEEEDTEDMEEEVETTKGMAEFDAAQEKLTQAKEDFESGLTNKKEYWARVFTIAATEHNKFDKEKGN